MDSNQKPKDLIMAKAFDMKIKQKEMKTVYIDENTNKLELLFILKSTHIYSINIVTKQLKELDFSKNHPVLHITGNNNNKYLIILFHNGKLFALKNEEDGKNKKLYYFKNLNTLLHFDQETKQNKIPSLYKIYASDDLDKIIIINNKVLHLWVKTSSKFKPKKNLVEYIGTSTLIQLTKERINLIQNKENFCENFHVLFGNNYFYGSYARVFYVICEDIEELNATKVYIIDYLFKFERENTFKKGKEKNDNGEHDDNMNHTIIYNDEQTEGNKNVLITDDNNEYKKYFEMKYVYTYIIPNPIPQNQINEKEPYSYYIPSNGLNTNSNSKNLIVKGNYSGTIVAIIINNCPNSIGMNSSNRRRKIGTAITLITFRTETYKFTSFAIDKLIPSHMKNNTILTVTDIAFINDDVFLMVQFSNYTFMVLNSNYQTITIYEGTRYISQIKSADDFYILGSFLGSSNEGNSGDNLKITLLSSMNKTTNYVMMFSPSYAICFYCYTKNYENRIFSCTASLPLTFDEFLLQLKYFQSTTTTEFNRMSLLDTMHNFIFNYFSVIFKNDYDAYPSYNNYGNNILNSGFNEITTSPNFADPIPIFATFVKLFRHLNQSHETNLTLLSYIICVSNDFFFYLLSIKELWLSFMFIKLYEKYILKYIYLKQSTNKNYEKAIIERQKCFMLYNPYIKTNNSLRCYNKISNCILHSKFRLLLIFYSLIEFRNSQALNINVLYFVLAKMTIDKLKKKKLYDDINFILKVIIRNWKFLKGENMKVGSEEYVLNGLTLNYKNEILSTLLPGKSNNSPTSIGKKDVIDFEFFKEFYMGDDLVNFNDLNEIYCKGDEENLINEYGYMNNIGIVQKWMLFFVNYFYSDIFDDFKSYLDNHLKQTEKSGIVKLTENISPEEMNLSKLIFFNLHFMLNIINLFIVNLIKFLSNQREDSLLSEFNKKFISFISPLDIPFIIYEFYNQVNTFNSSNNENDNEKAKNKKTQNDINIYLLEIIERYQKEFNMCVYDGLEFIEFIILKGYNSHINIAGSKIQKYVYSGLLFLLTSMVKTNNMGLLIKYKDVIFNSIISLDLPKRKDLFELLIIIINSKIKLINEEMDKESNKKDNETLFLKLSCILKELIYYILVKDEIIIRETVIIEFINNCNPIIKLVFQEGIMHYEYKTINKFVNIALNENVNLNMNFMIKNNRSEFNHNIFDVIFSSDEHLENIYKIMFNNSNEKEKMKIVFRNYILLIKEKEIITSLFNIEGLKSIIAKSTVQMFSNDKNIDKLINLTLVKFIYLISVLSIKYKLILLSQSSKENIGKYLKYFSLYSIFYKTSNDYISKMQQVTEYLINIANLNDIEMKSNLKNIIKNFFYGNLIHNYSNKQYAEQISSLIVKDQNIAIEYDKINKKNNKVYSEYNEESNNSINEYNSKKINNFLLLSDNEIFKEIVNEVIQNIKIYIDKLRYINCKSNQREQFSKLNSIFEELTGITKNHTITLNANYEYINQEKYISDIIGDMKPGTDMKSRISMNINISFDIKCLYEERQRFNYIKPKKDQAIVNKKQNQSIYKEEKEIIIDAIIPEKTKLVIKPKLMCDQSNEGKDMSISSSSSRIHIINPKSKNTVKKVSQFCENNLSIEMKTKKIIRRIKRIFFNQLLTGIFLKFKSQVDERELEQIELVNISPMNHNYKSYILTEKYISFKDFENSKKDDDNNTNLNNINYYDLIKLNKMKVGKGQKSKIFQELLMHRNSKKLNDKIRYKVNELSEKLKQFEEMTKQLGKNFVTNINK